MELFLYSQKQIEGLYKLKIKLSKFLPLFILIFLITIFAINLNIKKDEKKVTQLISPLINQNIPSKSIKLFQKEEVIKLKKIYKNLYAVNFFASWCLPCKIEAPFIKMLATKIPVFGIAFKDKDKDILNFLISYGNPYDKIGIDMDGMLGVEWGVYGIPETFIINKKGKIIYKFSGPLSIEELEKNIYGLIKNEG